MFQIDLSKYETRIAESTRRLEITRRFEEPDRVPILIGTAGSYYTRLFGYNIRDFYTDMDLNLEMQLRGKQWAWENLGDDRTDFSVGVDLGPVSEGLLFGLEILYPDDTSPWIVPELRTEEDVDRLEIPDPATHREVQRVYQMQEDLKAKMAGTGVDVHVGGLGMHPPLSAACAIMDPALVYEYMLTNPPLIRKLFDKLFKTFCALRDYHATRMGIKITHQGLADDNSAYVSNAMYRQFVFKYNKALYDRYGTEWRHLHADGPNDQHFAMYADDMKLNEMDIGGFSDIANAKRDMAGKTVMYGGLNNKDLYEGFEAGKPAIERAVKIGAPGGGYIFAIGGEVYYGVPAEALVRTVEYVKEIGRYAAGR